MDITAADRAALAEQVGVNEQYLYQCLSGRKSMNAAEAVRVERESSFRVRVWDLRQTDWHLIWPHLINSKGAPPVPTEELTKG